MKIIITILFLSITISVNCQQSTLEYHKTNNDTSILPKRIYGVEPYKIKYSQVGKFYSQSNQEPRYSFYVKDSVLMSNYKKYYFTQYSRPIFYITPKDTIVVLDSVKFNSLIKYSNHVK